MKQIIQSYSTGQMTLAEVPAPPCPANGVLVATHVSLVSAGTEKLIIDLAKKSLVDKAKSRPDLVKKVMDKVKEEGLFSTLGKVMTKLDSPAPLGYSCAGKVIDVGVEVAEFKKGDRVACAGAGYANHAEINAVPKNLCAKIPDAVSDEDACFTTLGAIAMQGIRRATLMPGETVGVIGLGLIGQLTVQILLAYGFRVLGVDLDERKVKKCLAFGMEKAGVVGRDSVEDMALAMTGGHGLDAVVVTAFSKTNAPIELAGKISRQGGRVSVVGFVGMEVPRDLYYKKELDLRLSRSYGPGRYDVNYEEKGQDYPYEYVRWTEKRNMEEFLRLISAKRMNIPEVITHRFALADFDKAYRLIGENPDNEDYGGILLNYSVTEKAASGVKTFGFAAPRKPFKQVTVGLIGCGNFAQSILLPNLAKIKEATVVAMADIDGKNVENLGRKYQCRYCTTDYNKILTDTSISTVFITTRHHLHAPMVMQALKSGKNVFVEKPLCLNENQLQEIVALYHALGKHGAPPAIMVGFNRRFAPAMHAAKQRLATRSTPLMMQYRVNAGYIPADHWVHDPKEGGGRIVGEVCHFVDLLQFLAGAPPVKIYASALPVEGKVLSDDNVSVTIDFDDGSRGTVLYTALGNKSVGKEYLEIFGAGRAIVVNDFKVGKFGLSQDKGHRQEFERFIQAIAQGASAPIPFNEIFSSTLATLKIAQAMQNGQPINLDANQIFLRA